MKKLALAAALLASVAHVAIAEDKFSMTESLDEYVRQARANQPPLQTTGGSLYFAAGANSDLYNDLKARRVNDILTVRISESTQAQSTADAQTDRSSNVALGVPNLFGLENHTSVPLQNLLTANTAMSFKGNGTTNRSGSVDAFLSTRVREVLPNGDMVIEGVKEVKVNNERQMLRLFGVVRPKDVGPGNVVLSTAVANMLVQIDGKGILSDNIKQGWLTGILMKVWPF